MKHRTRPAANNSRRRRASYAQMWDAYVASEQADIEAFAAQYDVGIAEARERAAQEYRQRELQQQARRTQP